MNSQMVYMPGIELDRNDFKTNLSYIRNTKRISQSKLAKISGVSLRMISKYETGDKDINKAQALTVYKLASALGVEVKDLLEKDNK